jgi:hypothetical protein
LAPDTYTVHWEGSGDDLQLNILQHDKPVASVSGHIVKVETPPEHDSALVHVNPEGSRTPSRFRGRKFVLEVSGENGGSGNASGAASRGQGIVRSKGENCRADKIVMRWFFPSSAIFLRT